MRRLARATTGPTVEEQNPVEVELDPGVGVLNLVRGPLLPSRRESPKPSPEVLRERERVVELFREGNPAGRIAELVGLSYPTVRQRLIDAGVWPMVAAAGTG